MPESTFVSRFRTAQCLPNVRWSSSGTLQQAWQVEEHEGLEITSRGTEWRDVPTEKSVEPGGAHSNGERSDG